ncbi:MAG: PKD domain-containing protein, partial [Baekduiaceae bacterium]
PAPPRLAVGTKGSGAWARKLTIGGSDGVEVREITVAGQQRRAQVASSRGGIVTGLEVAGSGAGDALVAFRSEASGAGEISAAVVDAPPIQFAATTPTDWVRPGQARISWDVSRNALGRVLYELFIDGTKVTETRDRRSLRLPRAALDDGRHRIQVRATDRRGQRILSNTATLRVDGTAPRVTVSERSRRRVSVRIADSGRSGLDRERSTVRWGDGADSAAANAVAHTYRRAGRFTVTVRVRDRAGNTRIVREAVRVR